MAYTTNLLEWPIANITPHYQLKEGGWKYVSTSLKELSIGFLYLVIKLKEIADFSTLIPIHATKVESIKNYLKFLFFFKCVLYWKKKQTLTSQIKVVQYVGRTKAGRRRVGKVQNFIFQVCVSKGTSIISNSLFIPIILHFKLFIYRTSLES